MITIKQAIVVEGKYDKIKLSSLVDATILVTDGFQIFKDKEKQAFLRLLADRVGLVVVTDSDVAGFRIRNFLGNIVGKDKIIQVYIPDVFGKEKRKAKASAEGKLGVEGMDKQVLLEAFRRAGVLAEENQRTVPVDPITKQELILDGLSGGENSSLKRAAFLKAANLPQRLTANALVDAINTFMTREEYKQMVNTLTV